MPQQTGLQQLHIRPALYEDIHAFDRFVTEHHYLQSVPAVSRMRLWILDGEGRPIGAMMWGNPTARKFNWGDRILELTRCVFLDDTEPMVESRALADARRYIRTYCPQVKGLLAYASTGQGHEGTIYAADGWFPLGTAPAKNGWTNRPGRHDRDMSEKLRWVRSP